MRSTPVIACASLAKPAGTTNGSLETAVEDPRTSELRVAILPDRGQTDAGGSYISPKVPRFRNPSQVQKLIK